MTNSRNSRQDHGPQGRWTGRTRFVTAASILAVGIAGAVAIGANIGILDAAEHNNIGELSAAGDLTDTGPQVVDVYLDGTTGTVDPAAPAVTDPARSGAAASGANVERTATNGSETFAVDAAGTVTIGRTANGLRLESVDPSAGWTWQLSQTDPTTLTVSFTDGARILDFTATLAGDGSITPEVVETVSEPAGSSSNQTPSYRDDGGSEHEGSGADD